MTRIGTTQLAYNRAGYRERYAITHGTKETKTVNGHKLLIFTYSENDPYQDANGSTYDVTEGRWIG